MSIFKRIISYVFLITAIILIIGCFKNIWRLIHADKNLKETEKKLAVIKEENSQIKEKEIYYKSEPFLEEQIRDKLQMAKPNEVVVILPEELQKQPEPEIYIFKDKKTDEVEVNNNQQEANWQKWLKLFWD